MPLITRKQVLDAHKQIKSHVRHTPHSAFKGKDFGLDVPEVFFKHEYMQVSGSFKARGAFYNMLSRKIPKAGVVAASGGNHGAAVAFAAQSTGQKSTIFVPEVTSPAKAARIKNYGADLVITGARYAQALEASQTFAKESGALPIHAFEQIETLTGQATLGVEIERDFPQLDTLLVAVGGGGLIGGIAAWLQSRIQIVAVEPEAAPTLHMALAAGKPVDAPAGGIAADSLAPLQVGQLMFPIAQRHVQQSILVSDDHIIAAQQSLWDVLRVVVEPGAATAFAGLLSRRYVPRPKERVGVLLCGANTTAVKF